MKSIFVLVFTFSLGVLAALADETPEFNEADTTSDTASLGSRNLDTLDTQDRFLSRKKRAGQINSWTGRWRKVNSSPVCFGARNHQFGRFFMPSRGRLAAIRLVHLYGYVSCRANEANRWSYWGCGGDPLFVAVTTSTNRVLFPPNQFKDNSKEFRIKAYNSWSPELVFSVFSHPHWVSLRQQLRVWYTQDLWDFYETDNGGRVCCDVYALYI